jgi:hypothetical protein
MNERELASRELSHILAGECIRGLRQPERDLRTGFAAQSEELRTDGSRRCWDTVALKKTEALSRVLGVSVMNKSYAPLVCVSARSTVGDSVNS